MADAGISDIFGSAFSSFSQGFGSGLGSGVSKGITGQGTAPAAPTALPNLSASDQLASVGIDFSDWTVSTGKSKASGATDNTGLNFPPWLMAGALVLTAVVAVRWIAKH